MPPGAPPQHPSVERKREEWRHLTDVEKRQIIAGYHGLTSVLDVCVGGILDALERLGLWDDTLIVMTCDHGDMLFENELLLKFVMRESAVRVPLMVRAPGGAGCDRLEFAEQVDVVPTVCDMLGIDIPGSVQGRSLRPLMNEGAAPEQWRDAVFSQIAAHGPIDTMMVRTERWKLVEYDGQPGELFDMRNDPQEFYNRIGEAGHAATVRELSDRIRAWQADAPPRTIS
ncbi:MAG: Choline-sulfatase [candidate division BRC1 bacterium ADurb.BinA364]|nr:MAG: Choline-sulfatase [candidate division BRC1 bacterium ADurb.BinA364]